VASRWAPYQARAESDRAGSPTGLRIRPALAADCAAVAAIEVDRDGFDPLQAAARCRAGLDRPEVLLLVAEVDGEIAGFGRVSHYSPVPGDGSTAPAGWYLAGVIVRDAWRRRGIGAALTRERLAWIGPRAPVAYYVANARNLATLDLHRAFGFEEISRDVTMPGVTFEGGAGVLARVDLDRGPRPVGDAVG
jgi:ribosomal protein S18 acetylase RimI-like enzyme